MSGKTDEGRKREREAPKKYVNEWLANHQDQRVRVKFTQGRQVVGVLKGYDQLMNLVLDDVEETLRDHDDLDVLTKETRHLGLVVVRGPLLLTISPVDGMEEIENPFNVQE
ncbi:Sm-like protein LSM7 [Cyberlindnera jadinii NRRL Y-1542]|uniref:U6 snRNA-associated Sm-like protein LSm7 n=1 Tax=Cyberlindnera jadinii (strain ATCC 18201 / CBS 1600 / BCRC 20928 / JCM 3617 / NBRC 0987 / NRRL Y-1542) TaxID=983966 RepID=A0A1E4S9R0_CYBJN|nr:U6 snRNA-associated Sm-like protein LSm7 [Cyberlindnera jadinii NRRL Y-1542]ODV76233.1 U6 snRNA-associated Sm-like protein LSm7 [Cyberlindnera jadinii NRRL Y-1542]